MGEKRTDNSKDNSRSLWDDKQKATATANANTEMPALPE
jgi:hypothetical protein